MFKINDKVVCVHDIFDEEAKRSFSILPKKNSVYVIRGTTVKAGVLLVGIIGPISKTSGRERGFRAFRFRKLDDIKAENKKVVECHSNDHSN